MTAVPCWKFRYEAEGFVDATEAIGALPPAVLDGIARDAGLPTGDAEDDPRGPCWYWFTGLEAMCDRDEGHAGPCRFVPQDEVVLVFR
jgi:hypothetical protein